MDEIPWGPCPLVEMQLVEWWPEGGLVTVWLQVKCAKNFKICKKHSSPSLQSTEMFFTCAADIIQNKSQSLYCLFWKRQKRPQDSDCASMPRSKIIQLPLAWQWVTRKAAGRKYMVIFNKQWLLVRGWILSWYKSPSVQMELHHF